MTDEFDTPGDDVDEFDSPDSAQGKIKRDRWGRPLIVPPGGGKPVAYTRTTRFIGVAEDTYMLSRWSMRQVAYGMAIRDDLQLAASACGPEDKQTLEGIVNRACEAANRDSAATKGTALHTITEKIDSGETVRNIPAAFRADVAAYQRATEKLTYAALEQFRVLDEYKVAGTADRLIDLGDRYVIGDTKTGNIEHGISKIAMQLAVYAHSTPYDANTNERVPDDKPIDLTMGIVIHLPVGKGECTLHRVDLVKGWEGIPIAAEVWRWRRMKNFAEPVGIDEILGSATDFGIDEEALILADIATIDSIDRLRDYWSALADAGRGTDRILAACKARADQLVVN